MLRRSGSNCWCGMRARRLQYSLSARAASERRRDGRPRRSLRANACLQVGCVSVNRAGTVLPRIAVARHAHRYGDSAEASCGFSEGVLHTQTRGRCVR